MWRETVTHGSEQARRCNSAGPPDPLYAARHGVLVLAKLGSYGYQDPFPRCGEAVRFRSRGPIEPRTILWLGET